MLDTEYYELLEVDRTADEKTIKSSYRRLAMQCHPDKNPGCAKSEAKFKAISEAYSCLADPQKRAAYDRYGKAAFQNGGSGPSQGFGSFSDIFENIFGDFEAQRGGGRTNVLRGADLRYDLEITLEDAYAGKAAEITVTVAGTCEPCGGTGARPNTKVRTCSTCDGIGQVRAKQGFFLVERTCPTCRGSGQIIAEPCNSCRGEGRVDRAKTLSVNVPPGVDQGTRIRLAGEGEAGMRGGPPGDLYIFIHLSRHKLFQREGTTLFARCPVSFTTAALGGTLEVPGLDGQRHSIRLPAGIQSGKQITQRGAGMPVLSGRGFGDMIVQVEVETPRKLTAKQKKLLEEFRATETGDECPDAHGFFQKVKGMFG